MTTSFGKLLIAAALPLTLVACGDGTVGGSAGGSAGQPLNFDTSQAYFDVGDDIFAQFEDDFNDLDFDDPAQLQLGSTVTYFGLLFIENAAQEGAVGGLRLDANFAGNSLSGSVTNMVDFNDSPITGQIDIDNGVIDRNVNVQEEFTFSADLSGTLTSTLDETAQIDGALFGDFYSGQEFIAGFITGEITVEGQTEDLGGGFLAER